MKSGTRTEAQVRVFSWLAAALVFAVGGAVLWHVSAPPQRAPAGQSRKQAKSARTLPEKHARIMMESAEVRVRAELAARLERFEKMAGEVHAVCGGLLGEIRRRPMPEGAPADVNDVAAAERPHPEALPPLEANAGPAELYERIAVLEASIQEDHLAALAARRALREGYSFPETLRALATPQTRMPGYGDLLAEVNRRHGVEGGIMSLASIADVNRYRELLGQAGRQSGLAESRLQGLLSPAGRPPPAGMAAAGSPGGSGDGGESGPRSEDSASAPLLPYQAKFQDERMVAAQALPGRRFSREASRRGWLYVNTWYMIGPWDSFGRNDFGLVHPPEHGVDLDATYLDGKTGEGVAETDSHPLKTIGPKVALDGKLRWKFMQSESMHNTVPVVTDRSTYYAYTELYFDEAATLIVAIGTDDSGKLWINGREIWEDSGTSWYHLDEHVETFDFQQGWNRVLVRLCNNGGAAAGFSFLLCPPDAPLIQGKD